MTLAVAILALAAAAPPPFAITVAQERLPLPAGTAVSLSASPFERRLVLHVPRAAAARLARRLEHASRTCPDVSAEDGRVVLRCRTERLRATVDLREGVAPGLLLQVLTVLPWRPEEEGPPLAAFDTAALGLGECGTTTSLQARGECALAAGRRDEARRLFEEAARSELAPLAELRLGDLALAEDEPARAVAHWKRARREAPWDLLAAARLCELDPTCLSSAERARTFDAGTVPRAVRADLALRAVRLTAFGGELAEAARALVPEWTPHGACRAAPGWCRHVLALALAQRGAEGAAALGVYLVTPPADGAEGLALARAAAGQAEAAGAPGFAASLLAARSGDVPPEELAGHLRRVAGLYLAADDRARAEEIFLFARTRLGAAAVARPEWARMRRALRPERRAAPAAAPDPDVASAQAALDAVRLLTLQNGAAR